MKIVYLCVVGIAFETATLGPAADDMDATHVVEKYPHGFSSRAAKLRAGSNAILSDQEMIRLAQDYSRAGRASGDPRAIRLATTLLEPRLARGTVSPKMLVIAAGLKSYEHKFDEALRLLNCAVAGDLREEALLQKVSILITLGRFEEARKTFSANPMLLGLSRGVVLVAQLQSMTGQLRSSYALLASHMARISESSAEENSWALCILAEMAERLGNTAAAETHYRKALELTSCGEEAASQTPGADLYLSNGWMDFLMDQNRNVEAADFAKRSPFREKLLLRKLIAAPTDEEVKVLENQLFATDHLREQALFRLKVKKEPSGALRYALNNWFQQKEAIDVRLVLDSAIAADNVAAAAAVLTWIKENSFEDARLTIRTTEEKL
jgi:hypothetical protein